jgi:hypothetical protein
MDDQSSWRRKPYMVFVAHPRAQVLHTNDIDNWHGYDLSHQDLESFSLLGLPARYEHEDATPSTIGTIVYDLQTPHDEDGRRIVVVRVEPRQYAGYLALHMHRRGLLLEGSILHKNYVANHVATGKRLLRRIEPHEFSLTMRGYRPGCVKLADFEHAPSEAEVLEVVRRTNPRAALAGDADASGVHVSTSFVAASHEEARRRHHEDDQQRRRAREQALIRGMHDAVLREKLFSNHGI